MESGSSPGGGRTSQGIEMFVGRGTHQYNYWFVIIAIAVIAVLVTIISINGGSLFRRLPAVTIEDKTLPAGAVNETGYYTDGLGWMEGQDHLVSEMKNYYLVTGVQPYIYTTDTIDGTGHPTTSQTIAFTEKLYDELFTDEGHILLFFFQSEDRYSERYVLGDQAKTVVDSKAANELLYTVSRRIKP